jgi:hypothetical protein
MNNNSNNINEGIFDSLDGLKKKAAAFFDGIIGNSPLKSFFAKKENDKRSKYEIALEKAAKDKMDLIAKNRKELSQKKDELKAKGVEAKGAAERNAINNAHASMLKSLDAQIAQLKRETEYWNKNTIQYSDDEMQSYLLRYNDVIRNTDGKDKTRLEQQRDLLTAVLYQRNPETGKVELVRDDLDDNGNPIEGSAAKKIKTFLNNHPDLKNELNEEFKSNREILDRLESGEAESLAETYCGEVQNALKNTPEALQAEEAVQDAKQARLDVIKSQLKDFADENEHDNEKKKEIIDALKQRAELYQDFPYGQTDNDMNGKIQNKYTIDAADAKAAATAIKQKLKKAGIDVSKIKESDIEKYEDGKYRIKDGSEVMSVVKDAIKNKKEELNAKLKADKDDAVRLGFIEDGDDFPPATSEEIKEPKEKDIPKDIAKQIAKEVYNTDEPTDEQIEEMTKPSSVTTHIEAQQNKIDENKNKISEKREKFEQEQSKLASKIEDTKASVARKAKENIDSDFTATVKKHENDFVPGTVVNDDGEVGCYNKDGEFIPRPKGGPDNDEERKKWETERAKSLVHPSDEQKEALKKAENTYIEVSKDDDGEPVYTKISTNDDGEKTSETVDRDTAIEIQKAHVAVVKTHKTQDAIKKAATDGDDFEQIKKDFPELKSLSDKEFEEIASGYKDANKDDWDDEEDTKNKDLDKDLDTTKPDDNDDINDKNADTEEIDDETGNKIKKRVNPTKVWHRKKKKNGTGSTKSYYNKKGESISPKEYKAKIESYKKYVKKHKKSNESINMSSYLRDKLIVERFYPNDITDYLKKFM